MIRCVGRRVDNFLETNIIGNRCILSLEILIKNTYVFSSKKKIHRHPRHPAHGSYSRSIVSLWPQSRRKRGSSLFLPSPVLGCPLPSHWFVTWTKVAAFSLSHCLPMISPHPQAWPQVTGASPPDLLLKPSTLVLLWGWRPPAPLPRSQRQLDHSPSCLENLLVAGLTLPITHVVWDSWQYSRRGQWQPEPRRSREGSSRRDIPKTEPAKLGNRSNVRWGGQGFGKRWRVCRQ